MQSCLSHSLPWTGGLEKNPLGHPVLRRGRGSAPCPCGGMDLSPRSGGKTLSIPGAGTGGPLGAAEPPRIGKDLEVHPPPPLPPPVLPFPWTTRGAVKSELSASISGKPPPVIRGTAAIRACV